MPLKSHFQLMADYNQWMNTSIYLSASQLGAAELCEDRGAFFGSILATLNHIVVGDTIWLKRFASHPSKLNSLEYVRGLEMPEALNATVFPEFSQLQRARSKMDATIMAFVVELTEQILSTPLHYKDTKGADYSKNFGYLVHHFFNHQSHHRGQLSTLLNQAGIDVGVTDLLVRIPNE